jgi:DNA-directed RNA polymerase subunit RPC12/RpoP
MDRYRCECGKTFGAAFEGEICPHCGHKVEYKDVDMLYTAYLNFWPFHVINPLMFHRLQSALSKKNLENIISNENIITSAGIIRKHNDKIEVKKSMLLYHNIGLKEFYDNYEEIMEYYKSKRKIKADLIDQLIRDKDLVWTSKIPVYSTTLRPMGISSESYFFNSLDKQIYPLTNISINLRKASAIEVPLYLYQAQMRVNELWNLNFSLIDGKYGWIRSQVLGGEFNYTGFNQWPIAS